MKKYIILIGILLAGCANVQSTEVAVNCRVKAFYYTYEGTNNYTIERAYKKKEKSGDTFYRLRNNTFKGWIDAKNIEIISCKED